MQRFEVCSQGHGRSRWTPVGPPKVVCKIKHQPKDPKSTLLVLEVGGLVACGVFHLVVLFGIVTVQVGFRS